MIAAQTPPERTDTTGDRDVTVRVAKATAAALADRIPGAFGHALEIPAYGEGETLFGTLASVPVGSLGEVLIVVVLNARRDSPREVHEVNAAARERLATLGDAELLSADPEVRLFPASRGRVLLIDRASPSSYLPPGQGVGLARKIGCDLMLRLHRNGRLTAPWIHATDADVSLPPDYFDQVAELDGVSKRYGDVHALVDVELYLPKAFALDPQRCAEAGERSAEQERRVKAIRQKLDRLNQDLAVDQRRERQRDLLHEDKVVERIVRVDLVGRAHRFFAF